MQQGTGRRGGSTQQPPGTAGAVACCCHARAIIQVTAGVGARGAASAQAAAAVEVGRFESPRVMLFGLVPLSALSSSYCFQVEGYCSVQIYVSNFAVAIPKFRMIT